MIKVAFQPVHWSPAAAHARAGGINMVAGPIDYTSHKQGDWDNCWFCSARDALAFHRPEEVARLVQTLAGGRYEVTFPGYAPVVLGIELDAANQSFKVTIDDCPDVSRPDHGNVGYAVALEHAADALVNEARTARFWSYGLGIVLLTGKTRTAYTNALGTGFKNILCSGTWWVPFTKLTALVARQVFASTAEILSAATERKRLMVLGGSDGRWTTVKVNGLANRHCYSLLCYESEQGTCRLRDPLGRNDRIPPGRQRDDYGPGEFWLTINEVENSFCGLTIEDD